MAGPLFGGGPTAEGKYPPDFLKWEEDGHYSREVVSITAGATELALEAGTVLENVSAGVDKEWDGTGKLKGILVESVSIPALQTRKVKQVIGVAVVDGR